MKETEQKICLSEEELTPGVLEILMRMSVEWEEEKICLCYRRNYLADLQGRRVFLAKQGDEAIAYLFGRYDTFHNVIPLLPEGTPFFELEELYVRKPYRNLGIGRDLFAFAEEKVKDRFKELESHPALLSRRTGHGILECKAVQENRIDNECPETGILKTVCWTV